MATGTNIRTYFDGAWHTGDLPVMRAADHGTWLGTTVFDGARFVHGVAPDLLPHCERLNHSAEALMITPTKTAAEIVDLIWQGLAAYDQTSEVYIRPMYWALDGGELGILPKPNATGFAISLEEIPLAAADATATLTKTRFRRPVLESSVCNAKAGCLYPNNTRMLAEARAKGFTNALATDALGNVAETATTNVFLVKDGVLKTPIANGTFLAGITRARHIKNALAAGIEVQECILGFDDFHDADEVFLSGNMMKIVPVSAFEQTRYDVGPITRQLRDLYWQWAKTLAIAPKSEAIDA